jgi:hypothetical protein
MLREDNGKVSAARVSVASSLLAFWLVFLVWLAVTLGLFFDAWPWDRFHDAIVAGGIGLLGVIFGALGGYTVNKYANARKVSDVWQD